MTPESEKQGEAEEGSGFKPSSLAGRTHKGYYILSWWKMRAPLKLHTCDNPLLKTQENRDWFKNNRQDRMKSEALRNQGTLTRTWGLVSIRRAGRAELSEEGTSPCVESCKGRCTHGAAGPSRCVQQGKVLGAVPTILQTVLQTLPSAWPNQLHLCHKNLCRGTELGADHKAHLRSWVNTQALNLC